MFKKLKNLVRSNRTEAEVRYLLSSLLDGSISDAEWDDFVSVKIVDFKLEKIRQQIEEIWTEESAFMHSNSMNPRELNDAGKQLVAELIDELS